MQIEKEKADIESEILKMRRMAKTLYRRVRGGKEEAGLDEVLIPKASLIQLDAENDVAMAREKRNSALIAELEKTVSIMGDESEKLIAHCLRLQIEKEKAEIESELRMRTMSEAPVVAPDVEGNQMITMPDQEEPQGTHTEDIPHSTGGLKGCCNGQGEAAFGAYCRAREDSLRHGR